MKIVVITRVRNEQRNIMRYWNAWAPVADLMLFADGGSTDNTIMMAKMLEKVKIRSFGKCFEIREGVYWNPEGPHSNFLIEWALEERPDWIVYADIDEVPNYILQHSIRNLLFKTKKHVLWTRMVHFWGTDMIIPELHDIEMTDRRATAWRPSVVNLWAREDDPIVLELHVNRDIWRGNESLLRYGNLNQIATHEDQELWLSLRTKERKFYEELKIYGMKIDFPACILHYGYDDQGIVEEKMKRYGLQKHPLDAPGLSLSVPDYFMSMEEPK